MLQGSSWSLKLIIKCSWADVQLQSNANKCVCLVQLRYSRATWFASPFPRSRCWAGTSTLPGQAGEQKRVPGLERVKQLSFPGHRQNRWQARTIPQRRAAPRRAPCWPCQLPFTSPCATLPMPCCSWQGDRLPQPLWSPPFFITPVINPPFLDTGK